MAETAQELLDGVLKKNPRSLSRLISWAENGEPATAEVLKSLFSKTGHARVWGITGPPGAGKSTLVGHLVRQCRAKGQKVAVLAVDPVSPFSGGALLGDRIRLSEHFNDPEVFIRSLSTRGKLGGLSLATREVVHACDAFGFDTVIIETVGVGQSEVEIRKLADTTVVVLVPEWGDGVQAIKAGILEIADLFAVHKADREGADRVASELRQALGGVPQPPEILLTQEKDAASLEKLFEALMGFAAKHPDRVKERRARGRADTLRELVEARVLEQAHAWVAKQGTSGDNPYEGFLKFTAAQKRLFPE